jgi:hypothetical protein
MFTTGSCASSLRTITRRSSLWGGSSAVTGAGFAPRGIGPKCRRTSASASGAFTSPAITRIALFGW